MFNSKKIKKMIQQQDLLDAKVNSLAHGQKSLSDDFEVHFKRLRQTIYTSVEEFSSELQKEMHELKGLNDSVKKELLKLDELSQLLKEESETIKRQNGILNENISRMRTSLEIDFEMIKDQMKDLKNQIAIPKSQLHLGTPIEVAPIGVGGIGVPTWTMPNGTSKSSPIQDKMKLEVQNTEEEKPYDFWSEENQRKIMEKEQKKREREMRKRIEQGANPWEELFGRDAVATEVVEQEPMPTKVKAKGRSGRLPIDQRKEFFVNATLPEGVLNYLLNRSTSNSVSIACRNVFEREGKLVFAPLSTEITKNFVSKKRRSITICVSKNTYLAMQKISRELETTITFVVNNFVASMDFSENARVSAQYDKLLRTETQITPSTSKRKKGRPSKK
jgi:hypothetical protein